jgi:protein MpaA
MRPDVATWELGHSRESRALRAHAIAPHGKKAPKAPAPADWPWVLFLGGAHGDEKEGVWLVEELLSRWESGFPGKCVGAVLWPRVNPDGVEKNQRWNAANVDLNRNLPTNDWTPEVKNPRYPPGPSPASEPENQALVRLIDSCRPRAILTAHSFEQFQVNSNGPAREWAECLAAVCKYPVTEHIGYPTPGSLGTYAGVERFIPTITLEIERGLPREKVLALHVPVAEAALGFWEENA